MSPTIIPEQKNLCLTCGTKLKGNYCWKCGERFLNPDKDYSIHKFIEQTVDGFTHFDSKFLRSFKALLFKPGLLTQEFVHGKRMPYMKPIQMFIIASVLFYFLFPKSTTFFANVEDMRFGNILKYNVSKAIEEKVVNDRSTESLVIKSTNTEAAHRSKAYLFLIIPFWGISFYLLFRRKMSFIVPHIIFAVHTLTFFIFLFLMNNIIFLGLGFRYTSDFGLIPMLSLFVAYLFLAIKKVYHQNFFWSAIKCLLSFAVFFILIVLYRQVITAWVLSSF